jgi:hypothetical protein
MRGLLPKRINFLEYSFSSLVVVVLCQEDVLVECAGECKMKPLIEKRSYLFSRSWTHVVAADPRLQQSFENLHLLDENFPELMRIDKVGSAPFLLILSYPLHRRADVPLFSWLTTTALLTAVLEDFLAPLQVRNLDTLLLTEIFLPFLVDVEVDNQVREAALVI